MLSAGSVAGSFNSHLDDDDDEPADEDQEIRDKTLPRWQIWLAAERSRDHRHWQPWRPDKARKQTEEDCEDPERQVSHHAHRQRRAVLSPVPRRSPRLARERLTRAAPVFRNVLSRDSGRAALAAGDGGGSGLSP